MSTNRFRVTNDMLASQGQRLGNYLLDAVFQLALTFVFTFIIGFVAVLLGNTTIVESIENLSKIEEYLLGAVVTVIYYSIFEITTGRSLGKYFTKTLVVDLGGSKPDAATIVKRSFCRLIPFNHFSFIGGGRGWHDTISDTYVVQKDVFEEKKSLFYSFEEIGVPQEN